MSDWRNGSSDTVLGDVPKQMRGGVYAYAAGSIAAGILDLIWRDFEAGHQPIQALGDHIPGRELLAYIAAIWLISGGTAILWRRTARTGAAALAGIHLIFGLFWLPRFYTVPHLFGFRMSVLIGLLVGVGQQFILVAAAAIVYASVTVRGSDRPPRALLAVRCIFGLSSVVFGLAHMTAMRVVAPMVPKWMPLGGEFWAVLTGIAFVLAGTAILSGILDVLAARLLALMLLVFSAVVLAPAPFAHPGNHVAWGSNAYNLAAVGAIWIFAESLATRRGGLEDSVGMGHGPDTISRVDVSC
jgi:uncharacterized membrane protein YphA (DoxX/SURF4 family)